MTPSGGSRHPRFASPRRTWARCAAVVVALVLAVCPTVVGAPVARAATPVATSPHASSGQAVVARSEDAAAVTTSQGYWEVGANGEVYGFGVPNYGDLAGVALNRPIVGMANDGGTGYWLVGSDGGIFSYGTAAYHGSTGSIALNKPIVGMAATADGGGYWLVASDGGVFTFGDAGFYGSTGSIVLNKPIVGITPTPDGRGYWLVASDGGIFAFGDAGFYGSTGSIRLNQPVVGMTSTTDGLGYRLVAADGGIFTFGDATFQGSTGSIHLNEPIVDAAATPDGGGYWLSASDGGIFAFGDAQFKGSAGSTGVSAPIVAIASTDEGNSYPAGTTGYDISWPQFPNYRSTTAPACADPNLPPAGSAVSIVGVNGGLSTELNTCFAQEAAWAGTDMSVYINLDNLTAEPSTTAAFQTGANDAASDVAYVKGEGYEPEVWWLDIEAPCGFSTVLWQCGAAGQALNNAVIQGALAELHNDGLTAGVYSTYVQWPDIAGKVSLSGVPIWIATVPSNTTQWAQDCNTLAFAGGTPYLVQWAGGQPGVGFDQDLACGT